MMKIKNFLFAACALLAVGCTADMEEPVSVVEKQMQEALASDNVAQDVLNVKFSRETTDALSLSVTRSGELSTGNISLDEICREYDVVAIEPVFSMDKFAARKRKAGLDQWYRVTVGQRKATAKAAARLYQMEGVVKVSPSLRAKRTGTTEVRYLTAQEVQQFQSSRATTAGEYFNDPLYPEQWMLKNIGTESEYYGHNPLVAGADINVEGAWRLCGGNNRVIVAVVDGGIEYGHPDLAANMWEGIGYNFVNHSDRVTAEEHGTHVAGTIAAVNDNGIGVCGIAGGLGVGDGVKLMSCQIFSSNGYAYDADCANAIVFGADNGAVISQNSWGYDIKDVKSLAEFASEVGVVKDAIDYFVEYAGFDENGNQVGPMAGGVVFFAAGNDGKNQDEYPAAYEKCFSVAAMSGNYRRAWYSTYSTSVDFFAPGGDSHNPSSSWDYSGWNLSTLPTSIKNGDTFEEAGQKYKVDYVRSSGYGYMRGTSMACPHVSGTAALIVSYCGGQGFTNERLVELLKNSAKDADQYQTGSFQGKVGKLINATAALQMGGPGDGYVPADFPKLMLQQGSTEFYMLPSEKVALLYRAVNCDTIEVSDKRVAVERNDEMLLLTFDASLFGEGVHKVVIIGRNDRSETRVEVGFTVKGVSAEFYPNPCDDVLNVRMGKINNEYRNCDVRVSIENSLGVKIFDKVLHFNGSASEELNVSALNPGRYQVSLDFVYNGAAQKITQTIIKK